MAKDHTDENLVLIIIYTTESRDFFPSFRSAKELIKNAHMHWTSGMKCSPEDLCEPCMRRAVRRTRDETCKRVAIVYRKLKGNRLYLLYISYYIVHHVLKPNNKKEPSEVQYAMHILMIWTRDKIFCFRSREIILYNSLIGWILSGCS